MLHIAIVTTHQPCMNALNTAAGVVQFSVIHAQALDACGRFGSINGIVALVAFSQKPMGMILVARSVATVAVATVAVTTATSFNRAISHRLIEFPELEKLSIAKMLLQFPIAVSDICV